MEVNLQAPLSREAWGEFSHFGKSLEQAVWTHGEQLTYEQFCEVLCPTLESGAPNLLALLSHTLKDPASLRTRFDFIDVDSNGVISVRECLRYMLREALAGMAQHVLEVLSKWDEDKSGQVNRREFRQAIKALGLTAFGTEDIDAVFDDFDTDRSGCISQTELQTHLRSAAATELEPG